MPTLDARRTKLLEALQHGAVMDDRLRCQFYRLGGSGMVAIRYDHRTLPAMAKDGLATAEGSVYRISEAGRAALARQQGKTA